jgi:tRNA G18 (ribose-2'-O)-methylase SpoU
LLKNNSREIFTRDRGFINKIVSSIPNIKVRIYTTQKEKNYPHLETVYVDKNKLKTIFIDNNVKFTGEETYIYSVHFHNYYQVIGKPNKEDLEKFLSENETYLLLDRVQDVRNLGAICRIARWAGVKTIFISQKGSAAINTGVLESSSGYLLDLNIVKVNLLNLVDKLKDFGIKIAVTVVKGGQDLGTFFQNENINDEIFPLALIMGNERYGVKKPLVEKSDFHLTIPLWGRVESLNLSVATGITLYEISKNKENQRKIKISKVKKEYFV